MVFLSVGTFECSQPRHPAQIPVVRGREGGRGGKEAADGLEGQVVCQPLIQIEPVCAKLQHN